MDSRLQEYFLLKCLCLSVLLICTPYLLLKVFFWLTYSPSLAEPQPNFEQIQASKVMTLWQREIAGVTFVCTLLSHSSEQAKFHQRRLQSYTGKDLCYLKVYAINFSQEAFLYGQDFAIIKEGTPHLPVEQLRPQGASSSQLPFYLSVFTIPQTLPPDHLQSYLVAFANNEGDFFPSQVKILWNKRRWKLNEMECIRAEFYQFLENPQPDFFTRH